MPGLFFRCTADPSPGRKISAVFVPGSQMGGGKKVRGDWGGSVGDWGRGKEGPPAPVPSGLLFIAALFFFLSTIREPVFVNLYSTQGKINT